jgi:hypothetical protein
MTQAYLSIQFLAELYAVGDENLMERAGFVVPTRSRSNVEQCHGGVATFADPRVVAQFAALHKAGPSYKCPKIKVYRLF